MDIFTILVTAANAVFPIIVVILLGYGLKQRKFLTADFLKVGNKLVFRVCLPAMLFINVYNIESLADISWTLVLYCVGAIVVIFVLGLVTALAVTKDPLRRGVLAQCAFRSNYALIGLSLVSALGGEEALAVAAVVSAFSIPVFNILAVIALSMFVQQAVSWKQTVKKMLWDIVKNPLIIGIALGLACLLLRELQLEAWGLVRFSMKEHLKFLYTALNNLKSVASPLALIVLGGEFEFSAVKSLRREILAGSLWRLVLAPVLGIGGAVLLYRGGVLTCGTEAFPSLVALFGSPVAVSSAIMAGSMGNDQQLATQLVVWTSLLSIVTIFATVCLLMGMGLITPL